MGGGGSKRQEMEGGEDKRSDEEMKPEKKY